LKDVEEVRRIHNLLDVWNLALAEAKPKIDLGTRDPSYDIQFVEQCMGFWSSTDGTKQDSPSDIRYKEAKGLIMTSHTFRLAMEHVYQVLENITTYLIELHRENQEWEEIQNDF
jgi:hypothetical protein